MTTRILHILPTFCGAGAGAQVALLAAGLPTGDYETHVCSLDPPGPLRGLGEELAVFGVNVVSIERRLPWDPIAMGRLRRLVSRLRPSIIQNWGLDALVYAHLANAGSQRPIVSTIRHADHWRFAIDRLLDRLLTRRTARVVAFGDVVKQAYLKQGLPADKLRCFSHGVATTAATTGATKGTTTMTAPVERAGLLHALGIPSDARLVASVGSLTDRNRLDVAVWALEILGAIIPNLHLLLIGEGAARVRLERLGRNMARADRIHFLGARDDLPRLLPHIDALWRTGGGTGQSLAVLEAMSAARAVIAVDAPGNRELLVDGKTGLLFPSGDRRLLARWTLKLLENPAWGQTLGAAARRSVLERFSAANLVDRYVAMVQELL